MEWCVYSVFCFLFTPEYCLCHTKNEHIFINLRAHTGEKKRPTMKLSYDNCYEFSLLFDENIMSFFLYRRIFVDCNTFCVFVTSVKFQTSVFVCDGRFEVRWSISKWREKIIQFPWIESIVTKCSVWMRTTTKNDPFVATESPYRRFQFQSMINLWAPAAPKKNAIIKFTCFRLPLSYEIYYLSRSQSVSIFGHSKCEAIVHHYYYCLFAQNIIIFLSDGWIWRQCYTLNTKHHYHPPLTSLKEIIPFELQSQDNFYFMYFCFKDVVKLKVASNWKTVFRVLRTNLFPLIVFSFLFITITSYTKWKQNHRKSIVLFRFHFFVVWILHLNLFDIQSIEPPNWLQQSLNRILTMSNGSC